jgi:1,4-dihydroxy-2-naphthoyl-CoA synthase
MYATWASAAVEIHDITGGESHAVVVLTLTMTSKRTGETFAQTVNECGSFENGLLKELRIHYFDAAEVAAKA